MTNTVEVEGVTVPVDHYIDGRRVSSETTFEVRSPIDWDNWKLAEVANGGQKEVDAAVQAARNAFPKWASLGPDRTTRPPDETCRRNRRKPCPTWPRSRPPTTARCSRR